LKHSDSPVLGRGSILERHTVDLGAQKWYVFRHVLEVTMSDAEETVDCGEPVDRGLTLVEFFANSHLEDLDFQRSSDLPREANL